MDQLPGHRGVFWHHFEHGGRYTFYRDARLRRLTRYRYNNAPLDSGGRYIYLRDDDHFSHPSGPLFLVADMAADAPIASMNMNVAMGWDIQLFARNWLASPPNPLFIPLGESLEIWELTLTNHREQPANLSVFSAVEFCLWDAWDDATNFQRNLSVGEVEVVDGVIYHKTEYRERRTTSLTWPVPKY